MKKLTIIFGAFFIASLVLTSCGDVNVEDLDKDIENEEDAVDALITLTKAKIEMLEKFKGLTQDLADLSKEMKKRGKDIEESQEDVGEKIYDADKLKDLEADAKEFAEKCAEAAKEDPEAWATALKDCD